VHVEDRPRRPATLAIAACFVVTVAACAYHVASVFFSRRVVEDVVQRAIVPQPAPARRALIVIIDGLRHDVALETVRLPIARELAAGGASGPSYAEDPTMTGAGVRALGTGTPPAFGDIVTNKRMPRVAHQHLFSGLAGAGHVVAVIGDHTWTDLFGDAIAIDETRSGVPPIIERLQPVYEQDRAFFEKAREILDVRRSTVTLVHLSGTDAVGHALGPHSRAYTQKLAALDEQIRALIDACGDDCVVVLTSDHGSSDRGHHGLGEEIARKTPLVLRGPGIRAGARFVARQADVAPTLATLLGAPVPGPARGRVLLEALELPPRELALVAIANAERLLAYAHAHAREFGVAMPAPPLDPARAALAVGEFDRAAERAEHVTAVVLDALRAQDARRASWLLLWLVALVAGAALVVFVAVPAVPERVRSRWRLAHAVVLVLAVELAFVAWREHATWLRRELIASPELGAIPRGAYALAAAGIVLGAALLVRRAWHPPAQERAVVFLLVLASAALGDYLLWPAALAGLAALLLTMWPGGAARIGVAGLGALATTPLFAVAWSRVPTTVLVLGAWLVLGVLAWWRRPSQAGSLVRAVTCAAGLLVAAGASLQLAGQPPVATRGYVAVVLAAWLAVRVLPLEPRVRGWFVGWTALALLFVLSHAHQLPGLAAVAVVIAALAALPAFRGDSAVAALAVAMLIIAGRFSILHLLEGGFSYSRIEWHAGRLGGAPTRLVGYVLVALKLALPAFALAGVVGAAAGPLALRRGLAWALAWTLLAMAHGIGSLYLTAGQYHTPYVDLSGVLFLAAIGASFALSWVFLSHSSRVGRPDRSEFRSGTYRALFRRSRTDRSSVAQCNELPSTRRRRPTR
jgi:hypothetical protein